MLCEVREITLLSVFFSTSHDGLIKGFISESKCAKDVTFIHVNDRRDLLLQTAFTCILYPLSIQIAINLGEEKKTV